MLVKISTPAFNILVTDWFFAFGGFGFFWFAPGGLPFEIVLLLTVLIGFLTKPIYLYKRFISNVALMLCTFEF